MNFILQYCEGENKIVIKNKLNIYMYINHFRIQVGYELMHMILSGHNWKIIDSLTSSHLNTYIDGKKWIDLLFFFLSMSLYRKNK